MNELNPIYNQKDLLIFFKKIRLNADKKIILSKIEENKPNKSDNLKTNEKLSNLWKNTKNIISNHGKIESKIDDNIRHFNTKYKNVIDETKAKILMHDLFYEDKFGLTKLLFSINIITDNEYEYIYEKEGLCVVSNYLYDDPNEIDKIKKSLVENYKELNTNSLSAFQISILSCITIASLVGIFYIPILIGGGITASASTTTAILAAKGFEDMQVGLGTITLESILFSSTIIGSCYGVMKLYNSKIIKQELKKLTPEKEAMYLAIQCVYIDRIRKTLSDDIFKEQLDSILKSMNLLKSDLDYFYFIEREDEKNNKEKIKIFHNFDIRLSKILKLS